MYLIGLTGSIGTGKTTVSNYLRGKKIPVIDSDQIARDVVKPGTKCWKLIREKFGPDAIQDDGQINRPYLGQLIFNNPEQRKMLNKITHPAIQKKTLYQILYYLFTFQTYIVLDIPLLFEASTFKNYMNYIIVVKCDQQEQLKRIKARNGYNDEEAMSRIKSQMSIEEKCQMADFVIDNNGSIEQTLNQVENLLHNLKYPLSFWIVRSLLIAFYGGSMCAIILLLKFLIF